jgi:hypothetical protein
MYSLYGFHSMSKQYREEALRDARTRHLEGWLRARPAWGAVLASLLRGARLTWQAAGRSEE